MDFFLLELIYAIKVTVSTDNLLFGRCRLEMVWILRLLIAKANKLITFEISLHGEYSQLNSNSPIYKLHHKDIIKIL